MESLTRKNRSETNYNQITRSLMPRGFILDKVRNGELILSTLLRAGNTYTIVPENPLKSKHRGRKCEIVMFLTDELKQPIKAKVKFLDNNRTGIIDLRDLLDSDNG